MLTRTQRLGTAIPGPLVSYIGTLIELLGHACGNGTGTHWERERPRIQRRRQRREARVWKKPSDVVKCASVMVVSVPRIAVDIAAATYALGALVPVPSSHGMSQTEAGGAQAHGFCTRIAQSS